MTLYFPISKGDVTRIITCFSKLDEDDDEDETKERKMSEDELVKGALESAFWAMDRLILRDKQQYRISGGCCAMVALFIFGKLYLANAGDSRSCCYISRVNY